MNFSGNTILVTGGATGIGLALARRLAEAGNEVVVCSRRESALADAQRECPRLHVLRGDVSIESERVRLIETMVRQFPKFNVLLNNAGIQNRPPKFTEPQDWAQHRQELATNLDAPMHLSMLAIPHLLKQPQAWIANVTSGLAFQPIAAMATYCATKAALHSFTLSLRWQLRETGIRVVEIAPPAVQTDLGGKGLHDFGVPLDEFADHAFARFTAGEAEFGYQSSEQARLAGRPALDAIFTAMNSRW